MLWFDPSTAPCPSLAVRESVRGVGRDARASPSGAGENPPRPNAIYSAEKPVAATRQSAANFPVSGKACGARPSRRYGALRKYLHHFRRAELNEALILLGKLKWGSRSSPLRNAGTYATIHTLSLI